MNNNVGRPKGQPKVAVAFKLPTSIKRRLLSYCDQHGTTQTWVLWQALEHFLDRKDNG